MNSKKRILLAPLDWGLGHASRCIPIVWQLEAHGFEVVFAAGGRPLLLLMNEFPKHEFIKWEGYDIRYPKTSNMTLSMLVQSIKIWRSIRKENRLLQQIISEYNIDGVISDNRFGLYSKKVPCVFITHQLHIQSPFFSEWIQSLNYKYIERYESCWIPDFSQHQLSGKLTKTELPRVPCQFIGGLSRFKVIEQTESLDILAVLSGPEPQRGMFENLLKKQLLNSKKKALLVLGKTEDNSVKKIGNLKIVGHLNAKELNQAMINADLVISRSGYSTIMDLAKLNKKAVFVPTPGQTEQLYLGKYFYDQKIAFVMHQNQFDLSIAIEKSRKFSGFTSQEEEVNWKYLLAPFYSE